MVGHCNVDMAAVACDTVCFDCDHHHICIFRRVGPCIRTYQAKRLRAKLHLQATLQAL
jgi:hypothetical protein